MYYQFDAEDFFSGRHTARQGAFRHDRDGFGPVVSEPEEVIKAAKNLLSPNSDALPIYRERMDRTFTYRDGHCCRRAYEAIRRRELPMPDPLAYQPSRLADEFLPHQPRVSLLVDGLTGGEPGSVIDRVG